MVIKYIGRQIFGRRGMRIIRRVGQGIIADAPRRRRTRTARFHSGRAQAGHTRSLATRRHGFLDFTTPEAFVGSGVAGSLANTFYQQSISDIPAASGDVDGRNNPGVNFLKYRFNGVMDFNPSGTPIVRMRVIVARIIHNTTPLSGQSIDVTGIYGRRLPNIKHVYYDRYFTYNGTDRYKRFNLNINLRGAYIHYSDSSSNSQDRDAIVLMTCADVAAPTSQVAGRGKVTWSES